MTSRLIIEEFKSRLTNLTRKGDPAIKGTPFYILTALDNYDKPFFGEFDDSKFRLTKNIFFPTPFIISGNYLQIDTPETRINYKVQPIWFGYLWIRILPFFCLIFFNFLLIKMASTLLSLDLMIPVNVMLLLMFTPILYTNHQKKKMERDFISRFEIE